MYYDLSGKDDCKINSDMEENVQRGNITDEGERRILEKPGRVDLSKYNTVTNKYPDEALPPDGKIVDHIILYRVPCKKYYKEKQAQGKHFHYVLCLSEAKGMDIIMIKIFRAMHGSINIEFDETGNCDILKMFNELYEGKEYKLSVEFDMGIIQKKKREVRENLILICKQSNEEDFVFRKQDENIVWVINQEDIELGIERFSECKKDGYFFPAEFIQRFIPEGKKLDYVYCRLVH